MDDQSIITAITLYALPIVLAITLHEAAHGFVAMRLGDRTAWMLGRVTINPLKHIDPIGTVLLPILFLLLPGGMMFGWAKPVPINAAALRRPKQDMLWVAFAGPAANLLMMLGWGLLMKLSISLQGTYFGEPLYLMARMGVASNMMLAAFNLLPLPPLDGGRILVSLLPRPWDATLARIEPFGFFILIGLMMTGMLYFFVNPILQLISYLLHLVV